MKHKLNMVFVAFMLTVFMAACGNGVANTVLPPTEAVEATTTPQETLAPTVQPTATETPTPEPTATEAPEPTEIPVVKDTYEYGVITEIGYASTWCDLRFTTQPGMDFGTQEGLEMYAQCVDGARVEIRTDVLPEEYLELSETDYLGVLVDELLKGAGNSSETMLNIGAIFGNEYTVGSVWIEDADGRGWDYDFFLRKKESRMIVVTLKVPSVSRGGYRSAENLIYCIGNYDSDPVYLPEERWSHLNFEPGTFTENGYENEWLNLRITVPEGATLLKYDSVMQDAIGTGIEWETNGLPFIGYFIEYSNNKTAEECINDSVEHYKSVSLEYDGWVYSDDGPMKTELLGGQEYIVKKMILSRPDRADRYEEYYCRIQDNYIVYFEFLYEDESREQIEEAKSLITEY